MVPFLDLRCLLQQVLGEGIKDPGICSLRKGGILSAKDEMRSQSLRKELESYDREENRVEMRT